MAYLFEGSLLSAYFRYYNISYVLKDALINDELIKKAKIKNRLNIYEGLANKIGNIHSAFCVNWLNNRTPIQLKKIKTAASNILVRNFKTKSEGVGFTTFKAYKSSLKAKGFSKGFIPVNERATNKYADKKTIFYFANRFLNPSFKDYFMSGGIRVDEDQWALAELIQWIW